MEILGVALNILKVVFGLGFVIFLHELGHFLAAKWNGVKVEKFFVGFDPGGLVIWSFKRGETVYGIGAIPLGGYVKMLGEERGEEGSEVVTDPRSFSNKSVGARIVILSAGVAMNVLLGLCLFTATQMLGVQEVPARIGEVQAGSPAYEAGLRVGDEIVTVDGRGDMTYDRLRMRVALSPSNRDVTLVVRRPGVAEPITIPVRPVRREKADQPSIGVRPSHDLQLADTDPFRAPPGKDGPAPKPADLPGKARVVEAGPAGGPTRPVADWFALQSVLAGARDRPVEVVVEAPGKDGSAWPRTRATLPVNRMMTVGLGMTAGPVRSIAAGSPASAAGFRTGDRIVQVDGKSEFDPLGLPGEVYEHAGKEMTFTIEREVDGKAKSVEVKATPDASPPRDGFAIDPSDPLDLPGLGMAIEVEPRVATVAEGGPAHASRIRAGAVLTSVTFPEVKDADGKVESEKARFGLDLAAKDEKGTIKASWPYVASLLQVRPVGPIELTIAGESKPITLTPVPDPARFNVDRGLLLYLAVRDVPPQPVSAAVRRGWNETYDNIVSIYAIIRSLFQGRVSPKQLAGLPRIAGIAYQTAQLGLTPLLGFLGMLSINLAVLNFLPIPPLDGGQIAFLLAEKVRGKPLADSTVNVLMIAGLVLVALLMLGTILQDLYYLVF